METKAQIINFLQENKSYIFTTFHISKIGLFGSFARDEQTKDSDVDVIVEIEDGVTDVYELKLSLKKYLSEAFGRSVDLAREKYLKPYSKEYILKDTIYV